MDVVVRMTQDDYIAAREDRQEELHRWISDLGFELRDIRCELVIERAEQSYRLHLSRYVRNDAGAMVVDVARDIVASEPVIFDLGTEKSWPAWLNAMPDQNLLLRLDAAAERLAKR
jgi:hypothetical protein